MLKIGFLFFAIFSSSAYSDCKLLYKTLLGIVPIHPLSIHRHFKRVTDPRLTDLVKKIEEGEFDSSLFNSYKISKNEYLLFPIKGGTPFFIELTRNGGYLTDETGTRVGFLDSKLRNLFEKNSIKEIPPDHQKQANTFRNKAREYEIEQQHVWDTFTFAPRLLFYPYALTVRAAAAIISGKVFEGRRILKATFGRILRDGVAVYGYYLLMDTGAHPSLVFVEIFEKHDGEIDLDPYLEKTEELLGERPVGITLFVDGLKSDDPIAFTGKLMFDRLYGTDKNAHYVKIESFNEFLEQVKSISGKAGKKIARVELLGHGNYLRSIRDQKGVVVWEVGKNTLTHKADETLNLVKENSSIYKAVMKKRFGLTDEDAKKIDESLEKRISQIVDLKTLPNLSKYFAEGAQVRFISCRPGAGAAGKDFMQTFGKQTVGDVSGKIASATRYIRISDLDIPPEEKEKREKIEQEFKQWLEEKRSKETVYDKFMKELFIHSKLPIEFILPLFLLTEESPGDPIQVYDFKTKRWTFSNNIPVRPRK